MAGSEQLTIERQLKDAVERHADGDGPYPKAEKGDVIHAVVNSGHDREDVEDVLASLLRRGLLYEAGAGQLGVV